MAWDLLRRLVQIVRSKLVAKLSAKLFKLPFTELTLLEHEKPLWNRVSLITRSPAEELIRSLLLRIAS